ncbi:MAG: hypothetical protein LAP38_24215 [Acidobacteriia bacterium]|nr:hypothetical protein [Terriglobia bacterium]
MLLEGKVYIRLTEDFSAFVCTVRYAGIFSKAAEYSLDVPAAPELRDERNVTLGRRRSRGRAASEQP